MNHVFLFLLFWLPATCWAEMTLEEKVGQLLIVHFHGQEANADAEKLISEIHVGGFILYNWSNGLASLDQVSRLTQSLQQLSPLPLFIGIDQEGGKISRLAKGTFPSNAVVGTTDAFLLAEHIAYRMGTMLHDCGVNLNFAPVIDLNNPIMGTRCFSSDPEKVALFGRYALRGYRKAGVIACPKHFPGYSEAAVDPHKGLPKVDRNLETMRQHELLPFIKLVPEAQVLMTAHLLLPKIDDTCVTLSHRITTGLLREELGFQGLIITDSLMMKALLEGDLPIEEATLQSFLAGSDLLLLGGKELVCGGSGFELSIDDIFRIHAYLVQAVRSGRISSERLDASLARILHLKNTLQI